MNVLDQVKDVIDKVNEKIPFLDSSCELDMGGKKLAVDFCVPFNTQAPETAQTGVVHYLSIVKTGDGQVVLVYDIDLLNEGENFAELNEIKITKKESKVLKDVSEAIKNISITN